MRCPAPREHRLAKPDRENIESHPALSREDRRALYTRTSRSVAAVATFALIHGDGGSAWDWHLVAPALHERGHDAVAVDLPIEDESAGWKEYSDAVAQAVGGRRGVVVVGPLARRAAPLACLENDDTSVRPESWEPHRGEARGSKHQEAATAGAECSPTASQPGWAAPSPSSELLDSGGRVLCLLRAGLDLSLRSQGSDPLHNGEGVHPYHALRSATGRNRWQRFWLVSAVFEASAFATGRHWLRPLCSIDAPCHDRPARNY